jgi:hypothetical protein
LRVKGLQEKKRLASSDYYPHPGIKKTGHTQICVTCNRILYKPAEMPEKLQFKLPRVRAVVDIKSICPVRADRNY